MQPKKILFLNLTAFSQTGGIEKFNKCFLKALHSLETDGIIYSESFSAYDHAADEDYYPASKYTGFKKRRWLFALRSVLKAKDFDEVILGHINLAVIGCSIKFLYQKKVLLITHGIEVWKPLAGIKKNITERADLILAVSDFTKSKLLQVQQVHENRILIFPDTLDPFFAFPWQFRRNTDLRKRYGLNENTPVLFTLTRLADNEQYKGCDRVIECLPQLVQYYPQLKYVVSGKFDAKEKKRLDRIIRALELEGRVIFTGFIKEEEVVPHFLMADVFIMPSSGEGFGIVFIEAMTCGLPVIAGSRDGSADALRNGELGTLVDPDNKEEIVDAVREALDEKSQASESKKYRLQRKALKYFGFEQYKKRLKEVLAGDEV